MGDEVQLTGTVEMTINEPWLIEAIENYRAGLQIIAGWKPRLSRRGGGQKQNILKN